jgi:hypothetical protein
MDRTGFKVGAALAALFLVIGIAGAVVALQGGGNSTPLPPRPTTGPSQATPSDPATP